MKFTIRSQRDQRQMRGLCRVLETRRIVVVVFLRSYVRKANSRKHVAEKKRIYLIDVSLVLVLKVILIVFSANNALVNKITNKWKGRFNNFIHI